MRHTIFHLLATISALFCADAYAAMDSHEYKECAALTRTDPAKALQVANEWSHRENAAPAFHCRAIALFALKRYPEAAKELGELSTRIGQSNITLWANVLRQSAKASELSGDNAQAVVSLTSAIGPVSAEGLKDQAVARIASELLLERSRLYNISGRQMFAVQDLDQALELSPDNVSIMLARARLFIEMKQDKLADRDIEQALQIQPGNPEAIKIRGLLAPNSHEQQLIAPNEK
mgnify:CR=1 FL=1